MKPKILIVCPQVRDTREIEAVGLHSHYEIIFDQWTCNWTSRLEAAIAENQSHADESKTFNPTETVCKFYANQLDAVCSSDDYPGSIVASIVAQKFGLIGPTPKSVMQCQNKYVSRCIQQEAIPHATPQFAAYKWASKEHPISFAAPWFVKPVKSFFSHGSSKISEPAELSQAIARAMLNRSFLQPFHEWSDLYLDHRHLDKNILIEEFIAGHQVTVEGFVHNGLVQISGIVDSIMFPGTNIFERFIYPSSLNQSVQERMKTISGQLIDALHFDNSLFNVEMIYDSVADRIAIVEINPRMSSQFADLFEKVDGVNSYEHMLSIAVGAQPHLKNNQGKFNLAASVVLRDFKNYFVKRVPTVDDIKNIHEIFPDVRIEVLASEGSRLGSQLQDGLSYRYGLINLGAQDQNDMDSKIQSIKKMLCFQFAG